MRQDMPAPQRRLFLQWLAGLGAVSAIGPGIAAPTQVAIKKIIPATGEKIPVIGMGSWLSFDVGDDEAARATRVQVLQAFFDQGGALIDSSPMYGTAQEVIGHSLRRIRNKSALFAATKVWIYGQWLGIKQMQAARERWGVARFDLMQIHNMLDWKTHLETLKAWKADGRIRYIGITTSHGRRHQEMEWALATEPFDFVQFTYNLSDRDAEQRLLPLAAERGIAVIINRPFDGGAQFGKVRGQPLPVWAAEFDCTNWAQFFLKFIVSHPAVTCAIPATAQAAHMIENMGAGFGRLPDAGTRLRMLEYYGRLTR